MRLSNQGQILDSKAGVGSVKLYVKKTLSLDFSSEIAVKAMENSEKERNKNLKMQEPETPGSSVVCLLCTVSVANVCLKYILEAQR